MIFRFAYSCRKGDDYKVENDDDDDDDDVDKSQSKDV